MLKPEEAKKLHLDNNASRIHNRLSAWSKAAVDRRTRSFLPATDAQVPSQVLCPRQTFMFSQMCWCPFHNENLKFLLFDFWRNLIENHIGVIFIFLMHTQ